jgi:hypothetical protein
MLQLLLQLVPVACTQDAASDPRKTLNIAVQVLQLFVPLLVELTAAHASYQPLCALCVRLATHVLAFAFKHRHVHDAVAAFAPEVLSAIASCAAAAAGAAQAVPMLPLFPDTFPPLAQPSAFPWTPPPAPTSAPSTQQASLLGTITLTPAAAIAALGWLLPLLAYAFNQQVTAFAPHLPALLSSLAEALFTAPLASLAPALQILTAATLRAESVASVCAHAQAPDVLSAACSLIAAPAPSEVRAAAADLALALASALSERGLVRLVSVRALVLPSVVAALSDAVKVSATSTSAAGATAGPHGSGGASAGGSNSSLLALARLVLPAAGSAAAVSDTLWALPIHALEALAGTAGKRVSFAAPAPSQWSGVQCDAGSGDGARAVKRPRTSHGSDCENAGAANGNRHEGHVDMDAAKAQCKSSGHSADADTALLSKVVSRERGRPGRGDGQSMQQRADYTRKGALVLLCLASLVRSRHRKAALGARALVCLMKTCASSAIVDSSEMRVPVCRCKSRYTLPSNWQFCCRT